jgi:lipopolysaccharide export system permease protein
MRTLRRYLWKEIATAIGFMMFALLSLFTFFDLVAQLDEIGQRGFKLRHALAYVAFTLPSRMYEIMPIAALIGTIYALSKLAANSEFTIMRVSGMSTRRLLLTLLGIGLLLVALTFLLGEVVSPPSERLAQQTRLKARGGQISVRDFRSGVWVRDVVKEPDGSIGAYRFVNVRLVSPDVGTMGWRIMEFDRDYRLRSVITATVGKFVPGVGWELKDAVETRVPQISADATLTDARTEVTTSPTLTWRSDLKPDIFGVLLVQPERMAGWDLAQYIRHLAANRQQTEQYEIAFWGKLLYPWAVLVMMALALPFAYLHVRAGGVSFKIFAGVMLGVAFYGMNKLFAHIGLLNTWPPVVVSAVPSLVVLSLAFGALYWIERR